MRRESYKTHIIDCKGWNGTTVQWCMRKSLCMNNATHDLRCTRENTSFVLNTSKQILVYLYDKKFLSNVCHFIYSILRREKCRPQYSWVVHWNWSYIKHLSSEYSFWTGHLVGLLPLNSQFSLDIMPTLIVLCCVCRSLYSQTTNKSITLAT